MQETGGPLLRFRVPAVNPRIGSCHVASCFDAPSIQILLKIVLLPPEERLSELGAVHLQVASNVSEDIVQCADAEGFVLGNGDVVLGAFEGEI